MHVRVSLYLCCVVGLLAGSVATAATPPQVDPPSGPLQGAWADEDYDVRVFRGVPYAQPPVGDRRWRPPQRLSQRSAVRPAVNFSPACWQRFTGDDEFVWTRGTFERSEDCLYLNVWTGGAAGERRPVMVWFHGGAHTGGYAHVKIFDGTQLARMGVVLVSVNYRLGSLGFLAHASLARESAHNSAGNYGLHDKIAALGWVRDNIAAFGGDPNNVTIFGQSAGSSSVCFLQASPLAKGLFHKAIGQSASCVGPDAATPEDPRGLKRGAALAQAAGIAPGAEDSLALLRALSPEALLQAELDAGWSGRLIVEDGWLLPEPATTIFAEGRHNAVPLLVGSAGNEGERLFPVSAELTRRQLRRDLTATYGAQANAVFDAYADDIRVSPGFGAREIATDRFMAWGMRTWARYNQRAGGRTYLYFMEHVPPAFHLYWPENPQLELPGGPRSAGAYHSGDLAFVFGNVGLVGLHWTDADRQVARAMSSSWVRFAMTGNPSDPFAPVWPRYTPESHSTKVFAVPERVEPGVRRSKLDLFDRAFGMGGTQR